MQYYVSMEISTQDACVEIAMPLPQLASHCLALLLCTCSQLQSGTYHGGATEG